jgi:hypothetical protein
MSHTAHYLKRFLEDMTDEMVLRTKGKIRDIRENVEGNVKRLTYIFVSNLIFMILIGVAAGFLLAALFNFLEEQGISQSVSYLILALIMIIIAFLIKYIGGKYGKNQLKRSG